MIISAPCWQPSRGVRNLAREFQVRNPDFDVLYFDAADPLIQHGLGRTQRQAGGVCGSTISFKSTETAALEACCRRALDCETAARRASR